MKHLFRFYLGICSCMFLSLPVFAKTPGSAACPGLLFATGYDKSVIAGSKDALIHAVSAGESIRVGWALDFNKDGQTDLLHWADAAFLSVYENEVYTQVDAVHTQRPRRGEGIQLRENFVEWRGSLNTRGELDGKYSDGSQFPAGLSVKTTWCTTTPPEQRWVLLYRNDADGNPVAGSKEALFAAIRSGQAIQVGWGFKGSRDGFEYSAEHLISPVFMTITNESDVSAQLPEHIAQQHYIDIDRALFNRPSVMWRGLMTTQGTFDAVWVDRATGETIRRYPQRATLSWYGSHTPASDVPSLAVPGGVRQDENRQDEKFPK